MTERTDVAIVGSGPAGAALAIRLARLGTDVVVLERAPTYRWHACGVFSPSALAHVGELGLDPHDTTIARPLPGLRLEVAGAPALSLFASGSATGDAAVPAGFDRSVLDRALMDRARAAGASVRQGADVTEVAFDPAGGVELQVRENGHLSSLRAGLVVGADGTRSVVAGATGARTPRPLRDRIGLTFHIREPGLEGGEGEAEGRPRAARMIVFDGGYCGLAPVPGGRLNVGIVVYGERARRDLKRRGPLRFVSRILDDVPPDPIDAGDGLDPQPLDHVAGAAPLGHTVRRPAGPDWFLVGDASGFVDPFTGEGLGRAFISAALAAEAITDASRGRRAAHERYASEMRRRFGPRDRLSVLIQAFVARPALLAYALRRIADREALARTIDLVLADRLPPDRALAPGFLAAILAP